LLTACAATHVPALQTPRSRAPDAAFTDPAIEADDGRSGEEPTGPEPDAATTSVSGTPTDAMPAGTTDAMPRTRSGIGATRSFEEPSLAERFFADPDHTASDPDGASSSPDVIHSWETGEGKSYLIPALDILGFEVLLNQFNRHFIDEDTYGSDLSSIDDNLQRGWVIDHDPFATNQFLHPYQGSIYHGFARSAGLDYWTSLGYDFAGSTLWEIAGETDPPSLNDEITTTFGGSFLGEALFRMSNLLLEGESNPGFWRRFGAGLISPSSGFNRLAFGERFDTVYDSRKPATFWKASVGGQRNARLTDVGNLSNLQEELAIAQFSMDYGLPGEPGYEYDRPFDYFHFEATLTSSTHAIPEEIAARGLLVGTDYAAGDDYRGIWGLYGSYDYISPEVFSVSSTALSLGTTGQYRVSYDVNLQGTMMGGVGWTAVSTIADAEEDRNYTYGYSPQALVDFRTLFGERVLFDINARDYYVNGSGSVGTSGGENILRAEMGLTVRVFGHHALGIEFVASRRDSSFSDVPDALQEVGALSLVYTYLGDSKLGAVRY
jgi:hypothetical protein